MQTRHLLPALCLTLLFAPGSARVAAAEPAASAAEAARPRIALVLSGGGARGFAHVGVLRALKDMRVPIDIVSGVSMGAVVGGAYASGRSVEELEAFVRTTDWSAIVADRPPRDDLAYRRREDDLLLPSRIEFGVDRSGPRMPPSTAANGALEAALARLLPPGTGELPVNRLALPFRTAASDLLSGELVVLAETPLFMSLRASLSVPGVFAPVRINQRLLIDGGLVRNLPVDLAREMGADVVIAVNVGTPLTGEEAELGSALKVAQQMLQILTEQNVQRSLKELQPGDVLISPDLTGVTFLNFSLVERAVADGERAAQLVSPQLAALSVSPEAYAAYEAARRQPPSQQDSALPLARLEVRGTAHASAAALAAQSGLREGEPVTQAQAQEAAARLFGRGEFERVEVKVQDDGGRREVTLAPVEAEWARSRLRVGLELVSDSADDNRFTVSAMHLLSWVNSWGAELRTLARVGSERSLVTQFWQPLAPGSDYFVAPSLEYRASSADFYEQGRRTLRVGYEYRSAGLALGRLLSNWGNVQLGVARRVGNSHSLVAAGAADAGGHFTETDYYAQVQADTLDSLALPSRGMLLQSRLERSAYASGESGHATFSVEALKAFRVGDWSSHVWGEWARAREGLAPISLGGFLRLTGTPRESVSGRAVVLSRLVMARRMGDMPTGLGGAIRSGFSLEFGQAYDPGESFRFGEMKRAVSGFVSVDTRFGPVFLAVGGTRNVGSTLYIFLGPFW